MRTVRRGGNGLVKIIAGIRRCGKSYLLFRLFKARLLKEGGKASHVIEIALDVEKFEDLRDPMALAKHVRGKVKSDGKIWYVFIDEIVPWRLSSSAVGMRTFWPYAKVN